ncbi:MAG: hypothetical protein NWE82_02135 [Candidatus Bathyarchaeota archaeon]|nr:hypothetical protein [Candidatus Bathyarchaeota archaeon]
MPKLKLTVESAIQRYLTDNLTDEGFREEIQAILDEFQGKNLLHQNIGQLAWRMDEENPGRKEEFERIWALFDQVSPRIRAAFDYRMKRGPIRGAV